MRAVQEAQENSRKAALALIAQRQEEERIRKEAEARLAEENRKKERRVELCHELMQAINLAHENDVLRLIKEADSELLTMPVVQGASLLHEACARGLSSAVAQMIRLALQDLPAEQAQLILYADDSGRTPLHRAAGSGNGKACSELIKLPFCDLQAKDKDGMTPLEVARRWGFHEAADAVFRAMSGLPPADAPPVVVEKAVPDESKKEKKAPKSKATSKAKSRGRRNSAATKKGTQSLSPARKPVETKAKAKSKKGEKKGEADPDEKEEEGRRRQSSSTILESAHVTLSGSKRCENSSSPRATREDAVSHHLQCRNQLVRYPVAEGCQRQSRRRYSEAARARARGRRPEAVRAQGAAQGRGIIKYSSPNTSGRSLVADKRLPDSASSTYS